MSGVQMCSSSLNNSQSILCIPTEVMTKILLQCDVIDILSFSCTNKHLHHVIDNTFFWKQKWKIIASSSKFTLPKITNGTMDQYKKACIRYYVLVVGKEKDENVFPSCEYCDSYTCIFGCVDNWKPKLVVDLGSKITRVFNATTLEIESHWSVYKIQDKFFQPSSADGRHTSSHFVNACGLQTCDYVDDIPVEMHPCSHNRVVSDNVDNHYDRQVKTLLSGSRSFCVNCASIHYVSSPCKNDQMHSFNSQHFKNEFCESMQESCSSSNQLFSPGLGMKNPVGFPFLVTSYLRKVLMRQFNDPIHPFTLRTPGSTVVICVPNSGSPPSVCRSILHFLFVEMKVGRACLIPKALGLAKTQSASCCIVIDSGAFSTSVAIVVDEKVVAVKEIPLGGWHLSKELHSALVTRGCISPEVNQVGTSSPNSGAAKMRASSARTADAPPHVPIISFDEASVKSKCRLSPFLHSKKPIMVPCQTQTVFLSRTNGHHECSKDVVQVHLKNEFTTGPEIHFAALDLPHIICNLTEGLPCDLKRQCLSSVLLTGGNSSLNGLVTRLGSELRSLMPEFQDSINVVLPFGPSELHTVMGASLMKYNYSPLHYVEDAEFHSYCNQQEVSKDRPFYLHEGGVQSQLPRTHQKGDTYWLAREEYIVFGPGF